MSHEKGEKEEGSSLGASALEKVIEVSAYSFNAGYCFIGYLCVICSSYWC
jgi:hypothetical protein